MTADSPQGSPAYSSAVTIPGQGTVKVIAQSGTQYIGSAGTPTNMTEPGSVSLRVTDARGVSACVTIPHEIAGVVRDALAAGLSAADTRDRCQDRRVSAR